MNKGDFVSHSWNGTIRFGTVVTKEIRDCGWAFYTIMFHDDSNWMRIGLEDLTGGIREKKWYRCDELQPVETYHLERSVYEHRQHSRHGTLHDEVIWPKT